MKTLLLFCLFVSVSVFAATPTFQSFDTNAFIANASANTIQANTSSGNPDSLVKQSQITSGGISTTTATNIAQGISNTSSNSVYTNITGLFSGSTNMVAFTNGPPVAGQAFVIVGTNVSGLVLVKGTNWPTGTGTLLPPNAVGVLTNNGSGSTNWSTSILGTWIGPTTLPATAADGTWPNRTNYVAYTNDVTAGHAVVIVGRDEFGSMLIKDTNWPSGGVASLTTVITTNSVWSDTNSVNHYYFQKDTNGTVSLDTNGGYAYSFGTNGLQINVGTSNSLGGISYIASNAAPFSTVAASGLNSIIMNQRWTNNFNRQATLIVAMTWKTNGGNGDDIIKLGFTNTISGESYTNSGPALFQGGVGQSHLIFPGISPGDYGSISNYSTGTSVPEANIIKAWWKLQ